MPVSQLRLLTLFLERPGELVTREEIAARLWVDARNIDVSTGINTAINRMRGHLQVSPGGPVSIETVIGLGYRFVADVEQVEVTESEAGASEDTPSLPAHAAAVEFAQTGVVEPAEAGSIESEARGHWPQPLPVGSAPARTTLFARYRLLFSVLVLCGLALLAALIPYGVRRWVQVREGSSSKDASGGLGPLIRITTETGGGEVTASAVAPDGQSVAYSDRSGVSVHWFASGQERLLGARPSFTVRRIAWFPDESQLLMSGTDETTHHRQVWLVPLQGAYLRLVAEDADLATVSPDGRRIAWTRDGDRELWLAEADGQSPRQLAIAKDGESFRFVLWAPAGDRLLATVHEMTPGKAVEDDDVASHDAYESIEAQSGLLLDREEGFSAESGYILDDGRLFFPYNGPSDVLRGGSSLMMVRTERRSGRLLGAPTRIRSLDARFARSLTASSSGARFAAVLDVTRTDVFVAELRQPGSVLAEVKSLTRTAKQNYPHAWTQDGKSVLIENDSLSRWSIYEQPLDGSVARLIASMPESAAMAQLSPDGRWVLFLEFTGRPQRAAGVFRVPLAGGRIEQVPTMGQIEEFHCSDSSYGSCVLREVADNKEFVYYALDPIQGMRQEIGRTPWQPNRLGDWGLSADGLTVAEANHDTLRPGIRLVRLRTNPTKLEEIALYGHGTILGSNWAVDGRSLFVECRTEAGFELVSLDLAGHVKSLRESPTLIWATPSRDGRKIAFPGLTISKDVWASGSLP
ncbi:winged helix-turn-helix domain-containing protein [Granulicella arctica]|uniref:DNA-binding winged helix-turn-helix (WHTH) protein n=1 Tax=Granulicella arctica TaxID=940613 RepID=A0A7Y9PFF0_9BACT|nr:winged helix-turn-helix domain-containing protein [Granulicella arctica]NYF78156.1 DNA-binding winged helix-turn-helix (wHTH) protein [Granulicella arctica]